MLTLAAVPIGRAEDASPRLAAELARATVIAAEDTRRVRWLAASLSITLSARLISYYDAVETRRAAELVAVLQAGQDVLLVTDAGMPGHQRSRLPAGGRRRGGGPAGDGAARAVGGHDRAGGFRAAHRPVLLRGIPAPAAGGAPAAVRRAGRRPPHPGLLRVRPRLAGTLAELAASHGADRQAVVCRELTKTHEEIRRGTVAELAEWAGQAPSAARSRWSSPEPDGAGPGAPWLPGTEPGGPRVTRDGSGDRPGASPGRPPDRVR